LMLVLVLLVLVLVLFPNGTADWRWLHKHLDRNS
jgi:hypothetical protein